MHSVIRRSFTALPFGKRCGQLSLFDQLSLSERRVPSRGDKFTPKLSPSVLFTFSGIRNRRVSTEPAAVGEADIAGDNLTRTIRTMLSISRGRFPKHSVCQLVQYDETKHDQDCCLRPKETIPNAPRTCNRLCWRKCQRFVIVSPWCAQFHLAVSVNMITGIKHR